MQNQANPSPLPAVSSDVGIRVLSPCRGGLAGSRIFVYEVLVQSTRMSNAEDWRPTILRAHARCSACTHTQRLPRLRVAAVGAGAITAVLGAASSILITLALGLGG